MKQYPISSEASHIEILELGPGENELSFVEGAKYIDLLSLSQREKDFWQKAKALFRKGTPWLEFDAYAFGMFSPLYINETSHLDVLKKPLCKALKILTLELGVIQGQIKRTKEQVVRIIEVGE